MGALASLDAEVRLIKRFLKALGDLLADSDYVSLDPQELAPALAFIELFIVDYHERREEEILFAYLSGRGITTDDLGQFPLIAHGVDHITLLEFGDAMRSPDSEAASTLPWNAQLYLRHARQHVESEEELYRRLRKRLSNEALLEVAAQLNDAFPHAEEIHEMAEALLHTLETRGHPWANSA